MSSILIAKGFLAALMLCLDIGIVNAAIISAGLQRGFRAAWWLGLGSCLGDLVYAVLAMLGMATLLQITWVRWVMWLGGGVVLALMAVQMLAQAWRLHRASTLTDTLDSAASGDAPVSPWKDMARGMGMAMASPSSLVWFAAVGGTLIAQSASVSPQSHWLFLSGFFAGTVLWALFMATLVAVGKAWVGAKLKLYSTVISACLFAYLAVDVLHQGFVVNMGPGDAHGTVSPAAGPSGTWTQFTP